jgi:hypothetical protein
MPANDTSPEIVMLKNLRGSAKPGGNGKYEIRIPIFQRGIVWSDDQKRKLIESIKLGYPVGSLMAFETFENNKPVWALIDGLQRTSTIIDYLDKPFKIANPALFYSTDILTKIAQILYPDNPVPRISELSELSEVLDEWLRHMETNSSAAGFHAGRLQEHLVEKLFNNVHLSPEKSNKLINYLSEHFFEHINKEIAKIEDATLPFIVYKGPEDQVPEIFERINSEGMKLSKYETFAATWTYSKVQILNPQIKTYIQKKYEELQSKGYVISGLDGDVRDVSEYNLFEYLFGLGKLLTDKHPLIFRKSTDPADPVPLGFVIATIAYQSPISKMKDLSNKLRQVYAGEIINLNNFEIALSKSCQAVEDSLRGFLKIKLNSRMREKQFIPHSDNQIFSYITRYLIERFDSHNNWIEKQENRSAELLKNIPLFYLLDILNGSWSGSGDSRLYRVTWSSDENTISPANDYLNSPTFEEWNSTLESWHSRELGKLQKDRTSNSPEARLLLKFLYQDVMTVVQNETTEFHIEHLWSVEKLRNIISSTNSDGWPIGALSNLALLEKSINETKGSVMLGDFKESDRGRELDSTAWEKIQRFVIWPQCDELKFEKTLTIDAYKEFCRTRFSHLKRIILREVGFSDQVQAEYLRSLSR